MNKRLFDTNRGAVTIKAPFPDPLLVPPSELDILARQVGVKVGFSYIIFHAENGEEVVYKAESWNKSAKCIVYERAEKARLIGDYVA